MPLFTYRARDRAGEVRTGTLEANTMQAARNALRDVGLNVEELSEAGDPMLASAPLPSQSETPVDAIVMVGTENDVSPAWKNEEPEKPVPQPVRSEPMPPLAVPAINPLGLFEPVPPSVDPDQERTYHPLVDTLRLYAGWLLAWYIVIYVLGSVQWLHKLPYQIAFIDELFRSPLVLHLTFISFFFLLLTSIHRAINGRFVSGIFLILIGVAGFVVFQQNV